jgi:hypothetical protein
MAVHFRPVNTQTLSNPDLEKVIYEELLPACEKSGVVLSRYGNQAYEGSDPSADTNYCSLVMTRELFNLARIQVIDCYLKEFLMDTSLRGFQDLKAQVQAQVPAAQSGDLAVAVLFKGLSLNFHDPKTVECDLVMNELPAWRVSHLAICP